MFFVVIYDIRDTRRLHRVAKVMESYGQRVQKSIFECDLEKTAFFRLRKHLDQIIDPDEDSIKFFRLCGSCFEKGTALGQCDRMIPLKGVEII